ncbi:NAC domain-containing protein 59-like [Herrania umbratica]|uniref:NAC domain-containing protein 59-like n=1 Tax=Herrania umbratica TaxID=108875 RepID=A0A6J1A5E8_9ROSI|nr:NAC domain-containing protein 59-like [Herrania umbratica]
MGELLSLDFHGNLVPFRSCRWKMLNNLNSTRHNDIACKFKHGKANEAYFFTVVPQAYSTAEQMEGSAKSGYWNATGETEQIDHHNEIVGFKRIFVFYWGEAPTAKESSWIERYALCRIIDKEHDEIED